MVTDYIPSYIEALVSLLVFGISIPTLLLNVPLRLRAIREQYSRVVEFGPIRFKGSQLLRVERVVVFVILAIFFILLYQIPPPTFFCVPESATEYAVGCAIRQFYIDIAPYWINGLLLTSIIVVTSFVWMLRSHGRDQIVSRLVEVCKQQAATPIQHIDAEVLQNLGELGEMCAAGKEKHGVLNTFSRLLDLELPPESWANMARAVTQTTAGGDERNIAQALELLQDIFRQASVSDLGETNMKQFHNRDILKELELMFIEAFETESPAVLSQIMTGYDELSEQVANDAAKAFLRIGRVALQKDLFQHAIYASGKMHTLIWELLERNDEQELAECQDAFHMYFALLAYFWNHGINTRQHAIQYMDQLCESYEWTDEELHTRLSEAAQAMRHLSLSTADMLEQMLYSNRQLVHVRTVLDKVKDLNPRHRERIRLRFPSLEALFDADVASLMACGPTRQQAQDILWKAELF